MGDGKFNEEGKGLGHVTREWLTGGVKGFVSKEKKKG